MPNLIQTWPATFGNSASARDYTSPAVVTAGDLIRITIGTSGSAITLTVTDSLGNTYTNVTGYVANGTGRISTWIAENITGGACTISVLPSASAYQTAEPAEYSTGVTASSFDSATTNTGTSATPSTGSVAVNNPNSLICAAFIQDTSAGFKLCKADPPISMRYYDNGTTGGVAMVSGDCVSDSAVNASWVNNASSVWAAAIVSIKCSPVAGGSSGGQLIGC